MGDLIEIPRAGVTGTCRKEGVPWQEEVPPPQHRAEATVESGDEALEAPPSIGLVFQNPGKLSEGDMLQGGRHRGLFLEPLTSDSAVTQFMLQVAAASQEHGTRLCMKVPVTHDVSLDHLKQIVVKWRSAPGIEPNSVVRCEGFVPVFDHPHIAGVAYFGSVEEERRPFLETVRGEHQLWRRAMEDCYPVDVDIDEVEILRTPSDEDISRIIEIYEASFDRYLCDLSDREAVYEMVTSSLTVIIREEGQIVSIAIAEYICLDFEGHPSIHFIEISDVAVHPAARSGGYAKAMYQRLCGICQERYACGREIMVITTEIRAICEALHRIMRRCRFEAVGFQPSHCEIKHDATAASGLTQRNGYGDLVTCVWDPYSEVETDDQDHWWAAYE